MENKKVYWISTSLFLAAEVALLFCILFAPHSEISCMWAIILVLLYSLLFKNKNISVLLMQLAFVFTLASDTFLVGVAPKIQWLAMTTFFIAQSLYFAKMLLSIKAKKYVADNIAIRAILIGCAVLLGWLVLKEKLDYVAAISLMYFASLIHNVILAFVLFKKSPLMALGMLLFLCCDIVVGLNSAIGVYISVPETSILYKIAFAPFNLAWTFYLPSQTMLALSTKDIK